MGSTSVLKWMQPVGQKELVQRQVSSFTFFSQNQRPQRWILLSQKKASLPNGPKSINLMEKHEKTSMYSMWYFWAIFGRDFPGDSRYSTIHLLQRKVPKPDSCNFRWVDDLAPVTKMYQQMCGENQKKNAETKKGRSFWMPANHLFWGNIFGGEGHKTLEQMMKTCTRPGETNISDRGKKKASSWEVPTGRGYC